MQSQAVDIHFILKKYWGYDSFRELQQEIIESVLSGHDTLGLLPTGGGKSLTFQIPAIALGGLCLVVTPLISLMKDQVDNLRARGLRAAYMHNGMSYREMKQAWDKVSNSDCRFLYISPERVSSAQFLERMRLLKKVTLVAVDEAHCISQWGYDFRPSYLGIARLRRVVAEDVRFMALTASATEPVARDICDKLEFRSGRVFRKSFLRQNISYVVRPTDEKISQILRVLAGVEGTSIIYVRSRARTAEIADCLKSCGIAAEPFHAGLPPELKASRQELWKNGDIRVMVATNAFGMGIDKPDVRTVIHYSLPSSLEEYYQEAGRAGRDGKPSYAVALYSRTDRSVLLRRIAEEFPDKKVILKVYERVCNFLEIALEEGYDRLYAFDPELFCSTFRMQDRQVMAALKILGGAGYMEFIDNRDNAPHVMFTCLKEDLYDLELSHIPNADNVIKGMLRVLPGLFADYQPLRETQLARETGLDQESIHATLLELSRAGYLSYIPRRSVPSIYMPTSRELPEQLLIPRSVYEDRREVLRRRIESVIQYAEAQGECRQNVILRYFGEKPAQGCGRCDNCREESSRRAAGKVSRATLQKALTDMLSGRPEGVSGSEIFDYFRNFKQRISGLIEEMLESGKLCRREPDTYFLTANRTE